MPPFYPRSQGANCRKPPGSWFGLVTPGRALAIDGRIRPEVGIVRENNLGINNPVGYAPMAGFIACSQVFKCRLGTLIRCFASPKPRIKHQIHYIVMHKFVSPVNALTWGLSIVSRSYRDRSIRNCERVFVRKIFFKFFLTLLGL